MTGTLFQYMRSRWKEVRRSISGVDITFLVLRLVSLGGGLTWLIIVPLAPPEQATLTDALVLFALYSLGCYITIFMEPTWIKRIYLVSLFLDLIFLSYLVHIEPDLENSFFVGYYLLTCLHTIYFGLRFGLVVAALCAFLYFGSIFHHIQQYSWTELAVRIAFIYLLAVPVGLLSDKTKKDKLVVENLNEELNNSLKTLKETQQKLIEAEKFSALGRLTAYITHEIRNPLTALGGFARRLEKNLAAGSREKTYASMIIQEASRLEKILLDTLIYGKAHDLELTRNDVNRTLMGTIELYRDLCREQHISLILNLRSDLPPGKINPPQLRQALDNLTINSIQAMPEGGNLFFATGMMEKQNTTFLTISISDTGEGMDPAAREYIFEPFYSTKKIGPGTGLGLAVVKKIIDEHQGIIEIDSQPGQGTRITLSLPYQSEKEDEMIPCWEYLRCAIETDPTRRCAAYPHFGRICWSTAGSFSARRREGICAQKLDNCEECAFYKLVNLHLPLYIAGDEHASA